jgi:hypothetical protein
MDCAAGGPASSESGGDPALGLLLILSLQAIPAPFLQLEQHTKHNYEAPFPHRIRAGSGTVAGL